MTTSRSSLPSLNHLREAAELEAASSVVFFLHRGNLNPSDPAVVEARDGLSTRAQEVFDQALEDGWKGSLEDLVEVSRDLA
jgi:hypothetical protein